MWTGVLPQSAHQGATASIGVRALIAELSELPARPSVAMRVLQLVDDPRTDATRLGRLVETDPALAAHTLRLANAPANGMSRRIASARHAVMVLGFELVRSLAALTAGGLLGDDRKAAPPGFWAHALATAAGSMVVARHTGRNEGDACSAGLLHDLGSALLYRAAPATYEAMLADTAEDPVARTIVEEERFELAHPEAGAAVLTQWHFPDEVVEVVRDHHRLPLPGTGDLVRVMRAGEALGDMAVLIDPGEAIPDAVEALRAAGVDVGGDDDLAPLVAQADEQVAALRSVLS